jgi:hypothetical protein
MRVLPPGLYLDGLFKPLNFRFYWCFFSFTKHHPQSHHSYLYHHCATSVPFSSLASSKFVHQPQRCYLRLVSPIHFKKSYITSPPREHRRLTSQVLSSSLSLKHQLPSSAPFASHHDVTSRISATINTKDGQGHSRVGLKEFGRGS